MWRANLHSTHPKWHHALLLLLLQQLLEERWVEGDDDQR
jgi:hypothetical protein